MASPRPIHTSVKTTRKPKKVAIVKKTEVSTEVSEKVKMKRLTLDISEDLHKAIKIQSVMLGIPMVDMLRKLLESEYGKP